MPPSGEAAVDATVVASSTPVQPDPFVYNYSLHSTVVQTVKMIVIGLVLFPIRSVVLVLSFLLLWLTAYLGSCGLPDPNRLGANSRPRSLPVTRFLMRVWCRCLLWALGYWWITVDGKFDPKARIIASNHVSFVDPFYFFYAVVPMAAAKAELFRVPCLGSIAKAVQAIPVRRASADSNRHDVSLEIKRRTRWGMGPLKKKKQEDRHDPEAATSAVVVVRVAEQEEEEEASTTSSSSCSSSWPPLLIFPEATCTNQRCIISFKYGAFAPRVPVQPVAIDFRQSYLDVSWPGDAPVGMTMVRMMCQMYNRLHVQYLPTVVPLSDDETVLQFAARVQESIATALRVPITQHTFVPPPTPAGGGRHRQPKNAGATTPAINKEERAREPHGETSSLSPKGTDAAEAGTGSAPAYGAASSSTSPSAPEQQGDDEIEEESIDQMVRSCSQVE